MDMRRLEAFAKVFETRSFSRAAKELFVSQPTISSHVALLEKELKVPLFDRVGRSVLPTQAGEILYERTQSIFHLVTLAHADMELLRHAVAGPLILGGSSIPAHYLLPRILGRFLRSYPDVQLDLRGGDTKEVVDMVRRGEAMIAMVGSDVGRGELVFEPVLEDDLVLVGNQDLIQQYSPASCKVGGGVERLTRFPWVMREPGSGTRQALAEALTQQGIGISDLQVSIQVQTTQAMLGCVLAGLGVAVTSRMVVEPYVQRGELAALALPELAMSRSFYLIHHPQRELFPVAKTLRRFLIKAFQRVSSAVS
ncbi:MAG: LysR family transcriptional regulator [Deltaproteobacteria bacterium]|nr:MAG: LysR family transcriptional regulator [Deltaproteobacteria bacterium]